MRLRRFVALPILVATLGMGAGTLYAAATPTRSFLPFGGTFWAGVAKKVGVSSAKLEAAVKAALKTDHRVFRGRPGGGPPGSGRPYANRTPARSASTS